MSSGFLDQNTPKTEPPHYITNFLGNSIRKALIFHDKRRKAFTKKNVKCIIGLNQLTVIACKLIQPRQSIWQLQLHKPN